MLARRPVTRADVVPLIRIAVRANQRGLVAENAATLAQAAYEPAATVWGLWEGDVPVGLVAGIDPREAELDRGGDPEAAYLWRLMIDAAHHQERGWARPPWPRSRRRRAPEACRGSRPRPRTARTAPCPSTSATATAARGTGARRRDRARARASRPLTVPPAPPTHS